jgi:hypothetical protein
MIGVVPISEILEHQDEIARALVDAGRIDVRGSHGCAPGDVPVERDLSRVAAQHLHRVTSLRFGGQLDDHAVRYPLTGQACAIQPGREAAVQCDLFRTNIGNRCAVQHGCQPLRRHAVDARRDFGGG